MSEVEIYTDGGCHGNPGPGGWAFVLRAGDLAIARCGYEAATTNNRMELRAVIEALRAVNEVPARSEATEVRVYTDSQYVKGGITQWMRTWMRNGWRTSKKEPVKNQDLWIELHREAELISPSWHWIKGHAGNKFNEQCDRMVQEVIAGH
ncbi:MAG: ribonuclease HI [Spirochaetaceae bacterium]|nr:MAG: ribonuclease HI [Spirochaetaceae bacterium]